MMKEESGNREWKLMRQQGEALKSGTISSVLTRVNSLGVEIGLSFAKPCLIGRTDIAH